MTLTSKFLFDPSLVELGRLAIANPAVARSAGQPTSLNGVWEFVLFDGVDEALAACADESSLAEVLRRASPVDVPGVWTRQGFDVPQYTNVQMPWPGNPPFVPDANPTGLYYRTFDRDGETERCVLTIGAAEAMSVVFCNGDFVGMGTDSRLESSFDLSAVVRDGVNSVAVVVPRWADSTWIEDQDHWFHGGIHRSVSVYRTGHVFLQDVVSNGLFDSATGSTTLEFEASIGCDTTIGDGFEVVVEFDGRVVSSLDVPRDPEPGDSVPGVAYGYQGRTVAASVRVEEVELWSCESPVLYDLKVSLLSSGREAQSVVTKVGFRSVEIRGQRLLINGDAVLINGVNRHDHHPVTGKTLSVAELRDELAMMKRFSINAVRTAHYPNDPALLDLCDELGLYVIDEANVEAHARHDSLVRSGIFDAAVFDRVKRMVLRDRSHPCVIGWSLGNEAGHGAVHDAAAAWVKRLDPTRFVQYEGGFNPTFGERGSPDLRHLPPSRSDRLISDVVCPMYASVEDITAWATWSEGQAQHVPVGAVRDDRPLILCEYSHAMGNSNGGLAQYWEAFRSFDSLAGGFIWDWRDQGLAEVDADGKHFWAYGGHHGGERSRNDANFCINGLVSPDLVPHVGLFELAWLAQPVSFEASLGDVVSVTVTNRRNHVDTSDLVFGWFYEVDGVRVADGAFELSILGPGESCVAELTNPVIAGPVVKDLGVLVFEARLANDTLWADKSHVVAHDHLVVSTSKAAHDSTAARHSTVAGAVHPSVNSLVDAARMTLWRPPTDNDRFGNLGQADVGVAARWAKWGLEGLDVALVADTGQRCDDPAQPMHFRTITNIIDQSSGAGIEVRERMVIPQGWDDLPRVGVRLAIPAEFRHLRWLGLGPHETYADRLSAARPGVWSSTVDEQYHEHVYPQEHGHHEQCHWWELTNDAGQGYKFVAPNALGFSALGHSVENLTLATTIAELETSGHIEIHIDVAMRGVGTGACGPDTSADYLVRGGTVEFVWQTYSI